MEHLYNPVELFLDFKKAIDTVDHNILVNRLDKNGVRDTDKKFSDRKDANDKGKQHQKPSVKW